MRSPTFIGVAAFVALLVLGSVAVWAYDASRDDKIADGVRVGGVLLGGLDEDQARAKLERELIAPLEQPVRIVARKRTFRLNPERAEVEVDVDALVDQAVERSREGSVVARTWRSLTGGDVEANIEPEVSYDNAVVDRLVRRIARRTERKPRDAKVDFSAGSLEKVDARYGVTMDDEEPRGQDRQRAAADRPRGAHPPRPRAQGRRRRSRPPTWRASTTSSSPSTARTSSCGSSSA